MRRKLGWEGERERAGGEENLRLDGVFPSLPFACRASIVFKREQLCPGAPPLGRDRDVVPCFRVPRGTLTFIHSAQHQVGSKAGRTGPVFRNAGSRVPSLLSLRYATEPGA